MITSIRPDDVRPQPWKNGGGTTRELVAWPSADAWQVRISVAEIAADGPFSAYPGVARWFTVLKGAGVELRVGDRLHRLGRNSAPLCFDGGVSAVCRLVDGPTRDLNLMLRGATGRMELAGDGLPWQPGARLAGLFAAVAGDCTVDGQRHAVPAYTLLWFDPAPGSAVFTAGARPASATGWWIAAESGT